MFKFLYYYLSFLFPRKKSQYNVIIYRIFLFLISQEEEVIQNAGVESVTLMNESKTNDYSLFQINDSEIVDKAFRVDFCYPKKEKKKTF